VYFSRTAASLGGAYAWSGRLEEAVPLLERADRHAESIGFAYGHALVITTLAEATLLRGDVENAACAADRALALTRQHGQRGWEAWTLRVQGEIAAAAGDRVVAGARYREALVLASELGMRPLAAHCQLGLGRLTGDRGALSAACEAYRAMEMTHWRRQAEALLV
jgi:tetratricopeptide (TPR) repeat protein